MTQESPYYTVQELAKRWHYTPGAVRRMIEKGKLPYTRIGHKYLLPKEDIHRMENSSGK